MPHQFNLPKSLQFQEQYYVLHINLAFLESHGCLQTSKLRMFRIICLIVLFKESDIDALKVIECLKSTGMPIKEIKKFIDWCSVGDSSLQQRYDMFLERKTAVEAQLEELNKTMKLINHKCENYKTALDAGTEDIHKNNKIGNF